MQYEFTELHGAIHDVRYLKQKFQQIKIFEIKKKIRWCTVQIE